MILQASSNSAFSRVPENTSAQTRHMEPPRVPVPGTPVRLDPEDESPPSGHGVRRNPGPNPPARIQKSPLAFSVDSIMSSEPRRHGSRSGTSQSSQRQGSVDGDSQVTASSQRGDRDSNSPTQHGGDPAHTVPSRFSVEGLLNNNKVPATSSQPQQQQLSPASSVSSATDSSTGRASPVTPVSDPGPDHYPRPLERLPPPGHGHPGVLLPPPGHGHPSPSQAGFYPGHLEPGKWPAGFAFPWLSPATRPLSPPPRKCHCVLDVSVIN